MVNSANQQHLGVVSELQHSRSQDPIMSAAAVTAGQMPPRSPRGLKVPPSGLGPVVGTPGGVPPPTSTTTTDNIGATLARLGRSICLSVEILATVGETIADENPEIRGDMLDACRDSRAASGKICPKVL